MEKGKINSLKIFIILLIFLNLAVLGVFGFWFYQEKLAKPSPSPSPTPMITGMPMPVITPTPESTLAPTPAPTPTLLPTPTPLTKSDLEQIKEAFSKKYSKPLSSVEVNIGKNTGTHASGGIKFAGEIGGGWFLAYKGSEGWIIVADGNGTIPCEPTDPYNFPVDMIPECYRESDGTIVKRG